MILKFQGRSEELADVLQANIAEGHMNVNQRARSMRKLAEAFIDASRFGEGLDLARAALEAAPQRHWEYLLTLAKAYRNLGQLDLALKYAREAHAAFEEQGSYMEKSPPKEELKVILTKLTITQEDGSHYSSLEKSKLTEELNVLRQAAEEEGLDDEQLTLEVTALEAQGRLAEAKEKATQLLQRQSNSRNKNG